MDALLFASVLTLTVWLAVQLLKSKAKKWKPLPELRKENDKIRQSSTYKAWRMAVLIRDKFTCQGCGKKGGYLEADHIKPFAYFPELRFDVSNGRSLCKPCHRKTPTYGAGAKKLYGVLTNQDNTIK